MITYLEVIVDNNILKLTNNCLFSRSASLMETKPAEQKPLMGDSTKSKCSNGACGLSPDAVSIIGEMLDFSLFKDPIFLIFALSNFCTSIGFNVPYVYILVSIQLLFLIPLFCYSPSSKL